MDNTSRTFANHIKTCDTIFASWNRLNGSAGCVKNMDLPGLEVGHKDKTTAESNTRGLAEATRKRLILRAAPQLILKDVSRLRKDVVATMPILVHALAFVAIALEASSFHVFVVTRVACIWHALRCALELA
jgi:hypothetical protein